ncbi:MAG: hypothetical protein R2771_13585 [Saprospiraceae bacterium]
MKTIYKILSLIFLMQTALLSQVEVISIIKPSGSGQCDGKINLGFVESELPYTVSYSDGNGQSGEISATHTKETITGLCAGTFTITAVDNHGCSDEEEVDLEECDLDVKFIYYEDPCGFYSEHTITTNIIKGENLKFSWSNGTKSKNLTNVPSGQYNVDIVDENGCRLTESFEFYEKMKVTLSNIENVQYCNLDNGKKGLLEIDIEGQGIYDDFLIEWSNGESTKKIENIEEGEYGVTVTNIVTGCRLNRDYDIICCYNNSNGNDIPNFTPINFDLATIYPSTTSIFLNQNIDNTSIINWTSSNPIENPNLEYLQKVNPGIYNVTINNGCNIYSESFKIRNCEQVFDINSDDVDWCCYDSNLIPALDDDCDLTRNKFISLKDCQLMQVCYKNNFSDDPGYKNRLMEIFVWGGYFTSYCDFYPTWNYIKMPLGYEYIVPFCNFEHWNGYYFQDVALHNSYDPNFKQLYNYAFISSNGIGAALINYLGCTYEEDISDIVQAEISYDYDTPSCSSNITCEGEDLGTNTFDAQFHVIVKGILNIPQIYCLALVTTTAHLIIHI